MRRALAGAIATSKSTERHLANHQAQAEKWYERAQIALDKDQEPLAREALTHRQGYLTQVESLSQQLIQQKTIIDKLKQDLRTLERKSLEAKGKKSIYVARLRSALASQRMQEILGDVENGVSSGIFEKIEAIKPLYR
jgi:phage shock protein A